MDNLQQYNWNIFIKIRNYKKNKTIHHSLYIVIAIILASIGVYRIILTYKIFSHTFDEPADIACGLEWLDRGTYLYGPDHPPLARIAVALGPYFAGIRLSETQLRLLRKIESNEIKWRGDHRWTAGKEILHSNNRYSYNLSLSRLGNIPFFLMLISVAWLWSRKLFGDISALLTLFFITSIPSILGHSGLATTDIALTSLCFSGIYVFKLWLELPSYRRCILLGLTWGLAAIAKFSALLFLPISAISILFWRMLLASRKNQQNLQSITNRIKPMAFTLMIAAFVAFVVIWSGYRFSTASLTKSEHRPHKPIERMFGGNGKLKDIAYHLSESPIFPFGEFFRGIWQQKKHNDRGHKSYLLGEYSTHGWWYFFPLVFLIKTPLSFLFFVLVGSIRLAFKSIRTKDWQYFIPILTAVGIMLSVMPANINLGIRYILIVYPLLAVIAGYGATYLLKVQKWPIIMRTIFAILLAWYIFSTSFSHPDYIAYFNEIAVESPERFRGDSDLDWGQDLQRLSIELKNRNIKEFSLAYFGSADPNKFNLPPFTSLKRHESTTGWVAISLNKLIDFEGDPPHDGYAWLRKYETVDTVGKSIKLYNIKNAK